MINFVDRQLITSLQIPLREDPELRLTTFQNQLLAGYAFSIVYSIAGLLLGDWPTVTTGRGWWRWGCSSGAHDRGERAGAKLSAVGALARLFVGIGEATLTPAAVAMIGDLFRPRQRAVAAGLYYLGIPIGQPDQIISNFLRPIPSICWRGCFSLSDCWAAMVVILVFLKDPVRGGMEDLAVLPGKLPPRGAC